MKFILFVIILFLSTQTLAKECLIPATSEKPTWIDNPLPESTTHFFAYGVADVNGLTFSKARKSSRNEARNELAESLSVRVTSEVLEKSYKTIKGDVASVSTDVKKMISARSDMFLGKSFIDGYWLDTKYCLLWSKVSLKKSDFEQSKEVIEGSAIEMIKDQLSSIEDKVIIIAKNTKKTPVDQLQSEFGLNGLSPDSFFQAMTNLKEQHLERALTLFNEAGFNLDQQVDAWNICQRWLPEYSGDVKIRFMVTPASINLISCAVIAGFNLDKLKVLFSVFDYPLNSVGGLSQNYILKQLGDNNLQDMAKLLGHVVESANPSDLFGYDYDYSLISFSQLKNKALDHKRGRYTLLHYAAVFDRVDVADFLIKNGAKLNTTSYSGYTPLALSIELGSNDFINFITTNDEYIKMSKNEDQSISFEIALIKAFKYSSSKFYSDIGESTKTLGDNNLLKLAHSLTPSSTKNKAFRIENAKFAYLRGIEYVKAGHLAEINRTSELMKQYGRKAKEFKPLETPKLNKYLAELDKF